MVMLRGYNSPLLFLLITNSFMKKGANVMTRESDAYIDLTNILSNPTELSPCAYQYYKNLLKRTIVFNEDVAGDIMEKFTLPLLEWDNDGTGEPITIYLTSVGGSLFDGITLCDIIDNLKTPTTIIVVSYAYSMGGLICMAGYNNPNVTKKCYKHSTALIHSGSTYLEGNTNAVKDQFKFHEKFEQKIKDYVLSHTKFTAKEYAKIERQEYYMVAEEMLEKGMVDEIIGV